jgi:hypothetical protein
MTGLMRDRLRRPAALPWAIAAALAVLVALAGSRDVFWTGDFYLEAYPAYQALMAGHTGAFFSHLPGYSGFAVVVGGPAALLTGLFGGHETMVFRLTALPGLIALCALAVAVATPLRTAGRAWWPLFLALAGGGPLAYATLTNGHPEDLLASALAVGGVLAARRERPNAAIVLLVAGVLAKQWAVLAILPAAFAAPRGASRIAIAGLAGSAVVVLVPILLVPATQGAATSTGALFHPHQVWWPFGVPATHAFAAAGHGTRMGPAWLQPIPHPLIVVAGGALALLWRLRAGGQRRLDDAFGVLALALLLRCMLDPWDLVYYHLPLIVALAVWEARRGRELPVLAVVASACAWLSFVVYDARTGDGPFFAYLAWTVPLAAGLAVALLRRPRAAAAPATLRRACPAGPISAARPSSRSTSTT